MSDEPKDGEILPPEKSSQSDRNVPARSERTTPPGFWKSMLGGIVATRTMNYAIDLQTGTKDAKRAFNEAEERMYKALIRNERAMDQYDNIQPIIDDDRKEQEHQLELAEQRREKEISEANLETVRAKDDLRAEVQRIMDEINPPPKLKLKTKPEMSEAELNREDAHRYAGETADSLEDYMFVRTNLANTAKIIKEEIEKRSKETGQDLSKEMEALDRQLIAQLMRAQEYFGVDIGD